MMSGYAHVVIDIPVLKIDHPFEYEIPESLMSKIKVGSTVLCPFGTGHQLGYVVDVVDEPSFLKKHSKLLDVLDEHPVFTPDIVEVARFVADRYLSTMGEILRMALPPGRGRRIKRKVVEDESGEKRIEYGITKPKVDVKHELYAKLSVPYDKAYKEISHTGRSVRQERAVEALKQGELPVHKLRSYTGVSMSTLKVLEQKKIVRLYRVETYREPDFTYPEELALDMVLTNEQKDAVDSINESIDKDNSDIFLLQGVTGSGKTEVYLRAIEHVLRQRKTAIVLVPEIALTPQTVSRFRARFGELVAVLHSGLGIGERYDQWRKIHEGISRVVVGARSAIWAPLKGCGLIVIDEEQEHTYKQDRNPRYHAREAAVVRAAATNATVVLGSATPSVESKYKADKGDYRLLRLTKRVEERVVPKIEIVDMRIEVQDGSKRIFSDRLVKEIKKTIATSNKAIIFLNRRGYSNYVMCQECGKIFTCPRCAVSLTYHSDTNTLRCHHCDHSEPAPVSCPDCKGSRIIYYGAGTERVERELKDLFPDTPVTRMDTDTTTRRDAHRKMLLEFRRKPAGILLGTQMIAKGLDFPDVTLVGVVSADTALALPDFRASERTFQLLMQVAGRAGRGLLAGTVIVQTYNPDNYAIKALTTGDYDLFYEQEITLRDALQYPPFSDLVNIGISARNSETCEKEAIRIGDFFVKSQADGRLKGVSEILGPAPAPIPKLKGKHRWHILIKAVDLPAVTRFIKRELDVILPKSKKDVTVAMDVDPVSLL